MSRVRTVVGVAVCAGALAACASGPEATEVNDELLNANEVIVQAEEMFRDHIESNLDGQTTTAEGGTRCFVPSISVDDLDARLFCGPLRELGGAEAVWYASDAHAKLTREGIELSWNPEYGFAPLEEAVPELNRPDGEAPVAVADLPEPEAPPYPESNIARLLPESSLDAEVTWEELAEPVTINTPAATFVIEASATLEQIPTSLASSSPGEGAATDATPSEQAPPFYSVAEGQAVTAWQVAVQEPVITGPPDDSWSPPEGTRDASTRLTVPVGGQRIPVEGEQDPYTTGAASAFAVACTDGVPCTPETSRHVLFMSIDESETPALTFSTDGADQSVDLRDGQLTSTMSAVADARTSLVSRVSTTWPRQEMTVLTEDEAKEIAEYFYGDLTYAFAGQIDSVYLTPFHKTLGWAGEGRAWLVVPVSSDPMEVEGVPDGARSYDMTETYSLVADGETYTITDASESTFTSDVPDTIVSAEFLYRPTGTIEVDGSPVSFQADEALTATITFEE